MSKVKLKPHGYWTKERCHKEAKKYKSKLDFRNNNNAAYSSIQKKGWINDVCSHMVEGKKPNGYWTLDKCRKEARKYKTRSDFLNNSPSAYNSSHRNNYLDEICSHMIELQKPNGYWTLDKCRKEAKKYKTRSAFIKGSSGAYDSAQRHGWLDDIYSHMIELQKPHGYWTLEQCRKEALKYEYKKEFRKLSSGAYYVAHKNGWLDAICKHMKICGNLKFRYVYVYEFNNNYAYVGLTCNIEKRNIAHYKTGPVYKHIKKYKLKPKHKILTKKPIITEKAQALEHSTKLKYIKTGWNILNKGKTGKNIGALGGGPLKWPKEKCHNEAKKYTTRTFFCKGSPKAYHSAQRNGWLNDVCSHMAEIYKPSGYWTLEQCKKEAKKYNTKVSFKQNSPSAYNSARKYKWLNVICSHMIMIDNRKPNGYWTKEKCHKEAKNYNSRVGFLQGSPRAYSAANKNGYLADICSHMIETKKPNGYWNKEQCRKEAKKYNNKSEFHINSSSAYNSAYKYGWLDMICKHMTDRKKPKGYWTKEKCRKEAGKYNRRVDFKQNSGPAYDYSYRKGWLNSICSHMTYRK